VAAAITLAISADENLQHSGSIIASMRQQNACATPASSAALIATLRAALRSASKSAFNTCHSDGGHGGNMAKWHGREQT